MKNQIRSNIILLLFSIFIFCIYVWGSISMRQIQKAQVKQKVDQPKQEKVMTIEEVQEALLADVKYDTKLTELDESVAKGMVSLQEKSKISLFVGEGTCADELIIIVAENQEDAKKDQEAVETHLAQMRSSFQDYIPEQAAKVDQAMIVRYDNYVIACVSSDVLTAKNIIVEAFDS